MVLHVVGACVWFLEFGISVVFLDVAFVISLFITMIMPECFDLRFISLTYLSILSVCLCIKDAPYRICRRIPFRSLVDNESELFPADGRASHLF